MDDKRLREIEARLSQANPGPWTLEEFGGKHDELMVVYMSPLKGFDEGGKGVLLHRKNAPLVANAPCDIRDLLVEVRRLKHLERAAAQMLDAFEYAGTNLVGREYEAKERLKDLIDFASA